MATAKTRTGKVRYKARRLADDAEVVSVKKSEKPADKTVLVELQVTKKQAALVEKAKAQTVTSVETVGGATVTKTHPVPLRLELIKPAKE